MFDTATDPEYRAKLKWAEAFVRDECEQLDVLFPGHGAPDDVTTTLNCLVDNR